MERQGDEMHAETDGARAGSTPNIVRWILIGGLLLAIVLLSATWIIGALSVDERDQHANVSREIQSQSDGDGTDSIVSDNADRIDDAPSPGESGEPTAVQN